jgi:DNA-directed RNA polymerase subunit RPC12/RpoP
MTQQSPDDPDGCPPGTAIQSTQGRAGAPYERRRLDETALNRVVQEHVETFFAQVEPETGAGLPQFVKDEFEPFLQCGILAHGLLRLRCSTCARDTLVAFSGKRRGFCPACGARRMAKTAAHLLDHVIPRVPVRQWVETELGTRYKITKVSAGPIGCVNMNPRAGIPQSIVTEESLRTLVYLEDSHPPGRLRL